MPEASNPGAALARSRFIGHDWCMASPDGPSASRRGPRWGFVEIRLSLSDTMEGWPAQVAASVALLSIAYSRYDPTFVATDRAEQRAVPTKWNTFSGTVGIGWDFRITDELAFRPILNGTLGRVSSDLKVGETIFNRVTDRNLQFLENGSLDAYGYGGSLMLDYEHYRENYEIDAELRATDIYLRSFGGSSEAVQGSAMAQQLSLWTRWRAPTGWHALDRPVRYVLEFAYSHYFGDSAGVLGFNELTSLGVGLELDSSKYPIIITRTRAMVRYVFGHNVHGVSFGFAMSF